MKYRNHATLYPYNYFNPYEGGEAIDVQTLQKAVTLQSFSVHIYNATL